MASRCWTLMLGGKQGPQGLGIDTPSVRSLIPRCIQWPLIGRLCETLSGAGQGRGRERDA